MFKVVAFTASALTAFPEASNAWDHLRKAFSLPDYWEQFSSGQLSRYALMEAEQLAWRSRGITKEKMLKALIDGYGLLPGARETVAELHRRAKTVALISETPLGFLQHVAKQLNIPEKDVAGVDFEWDSKGFPIATKPTHPTLNDMLNKPAALEAIARRHGARTKECLVIGNDRSDIPMFDIAGFSIAFRAKDAAAESNASVVVRRPNVMDILHYVR
ncbi:MAG TPA: HAD family hydrolase [archaeon]|nr:HAD family hydrolase [archaeon]